MKKFYFIVLFIVLSCTSVYADDIVELDSDGHINLVDRIRNTEDRFLPEHVQSGLTDSDLLNQIIDSSVSKFLSASTGGWSDIIFDVYNGIGVVGEFVDGVTTVTSEAIDKINSWFDIDDDGYVKTSSDFRADLTRYYNNRAFRSGGVDGWYECTGTLSGAWLRYKSNSYVQTFESGVYACTLTTGLTVLARIDNVESVSNTWIYDNGSIYQTVTNKFTGHYTGSQRTISYYPSSTYNTNYSPNFPRSSYSTPADAYSALAGQFSQGGYNGSMYMNTDTNYNPNIFIRSLPASNWQTVSNNRYQLVGSDPTEDSINNTFNSSNPVYNNVNYNYKFDDVYNNRDYPIYEFDSDNVYSVPDIELSTDIDRSNLFYDIGNSATDSEGGSFYVTLFGIIATFLILGVIL